MADGARALRAVALLALAVLTTRTALAQDQQTTTDDIPGEVAIDLLDGLSQAQLDDFKSSLGVVARPSSFLTARTHIFRVSLPADQVPALMTRLQGDPRIENLEPVARVHASSMPNDSLLDKQRRLAQVGAEQAWRWSVGRGVTVAVIDTGVACDAHPPPGSELANTACVTGFNFLDGTPHAPDDQGHGSRVAAAIASAGTDAPGLAFKARIMPVKVLDATGAGTTVEVADAVRFAADAGAHVINLSLGTLRASKLMRAAIVYARSRGVVIVAAAGDSGRAVEYPAAFDGVIAAPGASPLVAAAAALLVGIGMNNPASVERALTSSSRSIDSAARSIDTQGRGRPLYGAGVLDAGKAVSNAVLMHAAVRLALVAMLAAAVVWRIKNKGGTARAWRVGFVLSALAFGPGLLLVRPVGEWDMMLSASVHRWLPLANFFIPVALSAVAFGSRKMRPVIAGVAIGTGAYLVSQPLLGIMATTNRGLGFLWAWALINVVICLWVARIAMQDKAAG